MLGVSYHATRAFQGKYLYSLSYIALSQVFVKTVETTVCSFNLYIN